MSFYTVRPISDRTAFTGKHQRSQFSAGWSSTEVLLLREVRALAGRNLILECDVTESDLRLDGQIRSTARPFGPAIRVAFESRHGPLVYATDRFMFWQDNVRAIGLGLEALRRVDRYGITSRGEQYTGWKAIEAGGMGISEARDVLARLSPDHRRDGNLRSLWRAAQKAAHPDRNDGDRTLWDQVEQAARVLGLEAG